MSDSLNILGTKGHVSFIDFGITLQSDHQKMVHGALGTVIYPL